MSSRRPPIEPIERALYSYRMDTYVMIFLVGASGQTGAPGNLAIDVCRATPAPIVQNEQKKAAPSTDSPLDCTRQSAVLLRPSKAVTTERDGKLPNAPEKLNRPALASHPTLEIR